MLDKISKIIEEAKKKGNMRTLSVAAAHDEDVLRAASAAFREGIAKPLLVGDGAKIKEILLSIGEKPEDFEIFDVEKRDDITFDAACAAKACSLVSQGKAQFLMKGILSTADMMKAVLAKEAGLRTENLISHVMLYECASYPKLLALSDGGMNTFPDLTKKAEILENAAKVMQTLGYKEINAACICGAEAVSPKIQSTIDADELSKMTERWAKYNMNVFGPVGLDLAISTASCKHKKYNKKGAGNADILLVPTYEVGNGIGKAMTYFGGAKSAGIIVGAKIPIILVSRADDAATKLASIAFGAVVSRDTNTASIK